MEISDVLPPFRAIPLNHNRLLLQFKLTRRWRYPPRGRRTGGWADEASRAKTAKSVRMAADIGGIGSDDEEGMPIIPDLDDVRDEDMAFTVADAPSVAVNR